MTKSDNDTERFINNAISNYLRCLEVEAENKRKNLCEESKNG